MQNSGPANGSREDLHPADRHAGALQLYARAVGLLLLISFPVVHFGEAYVPSVVAVALKGTAAIQGVVNYDAMMRLGFASYLLEAMCDIVLALIFYVILRPVDRNLWLLAAFFKVASIAIFAASEFFYLSAMRLSENAQYLNRFRLPSVASCNSPPPSNDREQGATT